MKLSKQLAILVALCALGLLVLSMQSLHIIKENLTDARKHEIQNILMLAKAQVSEYVALEQKGIISRDEAESKVIEVLSTMRSGDSYIWANGNDAKSKVHPNVQQLGKFQDSYQSSLSALQGSNVVFSEGQYPKAGSQGVFHKINGMTLIPEWKWVFGYGIYVDDLEADFKNTAIDFWIVGFIILSVIILATIVLARAILKNILRNIGGEPTYVTLVTNHIADGNLNEPIEGEFEDDSLLASVSRMQKSLKGMVEKIQQSSVQLTHASQALNEQMTNISIASHKSSDSSQSTTVAIQQMSSSIEEISQSIHQAEQNSAVSFELSSNAEESVQQSANSINEISSEIISSSDEIASLQKRSLEIGNVINVIRDIAEQTNLLALNAAIEAARAGETGRGFAVVADEVRTLASRTATATAEITKTISLVQSDTDSVTKTMNAVLPKVEASVTSSNQVIDMLTNIRTASDETLTMIRGVYSASEEQSKTTQSLVINAEEISNTIMSTAEAIANSKHSTDELRALALELHNSVSYFKV